MAQDTDKTPGSPSPGPDEPTTPFPPGARDAPAAGPGEYVGKAQPIDPTRRRPAPPEDEASQPDDGEPAVADTGRLPGAGAEDQDEATAGEELAASDEEPAEEPPPARPSGPRTAPGRTSRRPRQPSSMSAVDRVRAADFPVVLRGYDRGAVDGYVAEVAQLVAELEATQLPETVVQRALDEVGEETSAILRQAHETSEEITARSRSQAAGRLQRAEQEADGMRRHAEEQVRRLEDDIQSIWQERSRLLEELRRLADEVLGVADDALDRVPTPEAAGDHGESPEPADRSSTSAGPRFGAEDEDTAEHSTGPPRAGA